MTWTAAKTEDLLDLMETTFSISEIAAILKVTRGAIAGKMARIREQAEQQVTIRSVLLPPRHWAPVILLLAFMGFSTEADASKESITLDVVCGQSALVYDELKKGYAEDPVAVGVTNKKELIEVLTGQDNGTWTIILSTSDGQSCVVFAGENWRALEKMKGPGT